MSDWRENWTFPRKRYRLSEVEKQMTRAALAFRPAGSNEAREHEIMTADARYEREMVRRALEQNPGVKP